MTATDNQVIHFQPTTKQCRPRCQKRKRISAGVIFVFVNCMVYVAIETRSQAVARIADRRLLPHSRLSSKAIVVIAYSAVCETLRSKRMGSWDWRDVIGHVTIWFTIGHFLLVVLWNQASISNGFRGIRWRMWRNGWHDLKRPLNKGQGHSFWYQSISHIRLL